MPSFFAALRAMNFPISSKSSGSPAGRLSSTTPMPLPWLSPKMETEIPPLNNDDIVFTSKRSEILEESGVALCNALGVGNGQRGGAPLRSNGEGHCDTVVVEAGAYAAGKLPDACYLKLVVDYADVRAQRIQHGGDRDQTVAFLYAKALAARRVCGNLPRQMTRAR